MAGHPQLKVFDNDDLMMILTALGRELMEGNERIKSTMDTIQAEYLARKREQFDPTQLEEQLIACLSEEKLLGSDIVSIHVDRIKEMLRLLDLMEYLRRNRDLSPLIETVLYERNRGWPFYK